MKKLFCLGLSLLLAASVFGCGQKETAAVVPEQKQSAPTAAPTPTPTPVPTEKPIQVPQTPQPDKTNTAVDVDLTTLSSTMVYSEVYNMLYENTADYIGKTVKMKGAFGVAQVVIDGVAQQEPTAYACVIADATACCTQGIEFVLSGEHTYPQDYPELGEEITVVGTFETYEADGIPGIHLVDATML